MNTTPFRFFVSVLFAALTAVVSAQDRSAPGRTPAPAGKIYELGPDSLPQEGVPKGKLEGPFLFKSQIFSNTVRRYWVYVPAQYTPEKPACVLVFQDPK